jgi:hypothetical protein
MFFNIPSPKLISIPDSKKFKVDFDFSVAKDFALSKSLSEIAAKKSLTVVSGLFPEQDNSKAIDNNPMNLTILILVFFKLKMKIQKKAQL